MASQKERARNWTARMPEWVGAGIVGMVISIPIAVLIARHYYERSAHDSEVQMSQLESQLKELQDIVNEAVHSGAVVPQYNGQGRIVALRKPLPPKGVQVH